MSKYAIVKISGKQYRVSEGDLLDLPGNIGKPKVEVLAFFDNSKVVSDKAELDLAKVQFSLVGTGKARKIKVGHFKAKSRYDKTRGYRETLSRIMIEKILFGKEPVKAEKAAKEVTTKKKEIKKLPVKKAMAKKG